MTTSGTVGQTVIDVATIIEHVFRRAGKSPADQTPDALKAAQENLYFYLCQLVNNGINLWTLEKDLFGTVIGQDNYAMLPGTVDVRDALYRTVNLASGGGASSSSGGNGNAAFTQILTPANACTQNSANGNIMYAFASPVSITNVGIITNGNQTYTPAWEASVDNVNWTTVLQTPETNYIGGQWAYYDIGSPVNAQFFRIRETGGGVLNVTQLAFNTIIDEILMARLNFQQYTSLTNKTFQSRNILQYFMDRQLPQSLMRIWPVSNYAFDQIVVWRKRQIQDVGSAMTNTIEIPQYWTESLINETAARTILELPGADLKRYQMLKDEAAASTLLAQAEERDNSPITFAPNISCYTGG